MQKEILDKNSITKESLRQRMLKLMKASPKPSAKEVMERITALDAYKKANCLIGYCPLKSEIDVSQVLDKAIEEGKKVLVPDLEVGTFRVAKKDWKDSLIKLRNGTHTVDTYERISIAYLSALNDVSIVVLVPALAFTEDGTRLGRGSGYYDQLLKRASGGNITTIGICRKFQLLEVLPQQPHDQKVAMVIAF